MLGIVDQLSTRPPGATFADGDALVVLGPSAGAALDYALHTAVCAQVAELVHDGVVNGVHDVADGGVALTLAEMAVRSGIGFRVTVPEPFLESPSRVVVAVSPERVHDIECTVIGTAGGDRLIIDGVIDIGLADATSTWRDRLPTALSAGTAQ
jgi:phosphoribosylformylglycinamidine synthase